MNLECVVEEKVVFDVKSRKIVEKLIRKWGVAVEQISSLVCE